MVQSQLSPQEFIKNEFIPNIAILHSSAVDTICQKNNLSFVQLLEPFTKLNNDANIQDGNGGVINIHNLKVLFRDANYRPPQPGLAHIMLNRCVSSNTESQIEEVHAGNYNLQIPAHTSWFDFWRNMYLKVQRPSDHEFTKHYLACILVVSSNDNSPVEMMDQLGQTLNQLQSTPTHKLPKWFNSSILRYYCIVHDNLEGDLEKATQCYEDFKISFGPNSCFLLQINSRANTEVVNALPDPWKQYTLPYYKTVGKNHTSPDISPNFPRTTSTSVEATSSGDLPYHPLSPNSESVQLLQDEPKETVGSSLSLSHGTSLTTEDIQQIKLFVSEFCTKALLPYVEKLIQNLNDMVTNKKGVGKSLFSATKRWFIPGKMTSTNSGTHLLIYPFEAPELQIRRLGDLYFMFGHYSLAYQVYHACKQDFNNEQAWFYYAGVLEMASLAAFMANESTRKTFDYIEEAIVTYLNTAKYARMTQFATRATLFSTECLKLRNLHGEAAHQLIRMTGEESDLRSALLLEQAALCFLNSSRPQMAHKYAFHMVLAGHRFSKSAQKQHALRCYKQALQVYKNSKWSFAEDHIHYTIGKLSTNLGNYEEAVKSFELLLTVQSKQSVEQQTLFLEEYLSLQRTLAKDHSDTHSSVLLLPVIKSDTLKILAGPILPPFMPKKVGALGVSFDSHDNPTETEMWNRLEEMIIQEAQGSLPITFKSAVVLYTKQNIPNAKVSAVVNELIQVSVAVYNPLSVPLILQDIYLLWTFKDTMGNVIDNSSDKAINFLRTHIHKSFLSQSNNTQDLILSITPLIIGELQLTGIAYSIYNSYNSEAIVFVTGKQYFNLQQLGLVEDSKLVISITPPVPYLQVTFGEIRTDILCNEIQEIPVEMRNAGRVPLHKIYLVTSREELFSMCEIDNQFVLTPDVHSVPLPIDCILPGLTHYFSLWLKAPNTDGPLTIDLLIYYESTETTSKARYRLIRHTWKFNVHRSLDINLKVMEGHNFKKTQELIYIAKIENWSEQNFYFDVGISSVGFLSTVWDLTPCGKGLEDAKIFAGESLNILFKGSRSPQQKFILMRCNRAPPVDISKTNPLGAAYIEFIKNCALNKGNVLPETVTKPEGEIINKPEGEKINKPKIRKKLQDVVTFHWNAEVTKDSYFQYFSNGQYCTLLNKIEYINDNSYQETGDTVINSIPIESQFTELGHEATHDQLHRQITLCLFHDDIVNHDFKVNRICIIPITIVLYNVSVKSLVTVKSINTTTDNKRSSNFPTGTSYLFDPLPSNNYRWVNVNTSINTIPPLKSKKILFHIAVTSPGIYDLGSRLEVWCKNDYHSDPILQRIHISKCIIVSNVQN